MGSTSITLSIHARRRATGRRLSLAAIEAAMDYGRAFRRHGAWLFRLDRRSVASALRRGLDLAAFEGLHVVVSDDGMLITAYRNRRGFRVQR